MQSILHISLAEATGPIRYNMTNDYMFRYILQKNKKVLKGLISSLLHLNMDEIRSIEITNPIDLAEEIWGKDFVLDIAVILNNETKINLEMQVTNRHNWTDRSLSYICRTYDQLYRGHEYEEALPCIHIGFLDFTLFPESPEFYAVHKLLNIKNHRLFSDKITLSVVDLTQIELATEEDKVYGIDYWARIFKAKTWEEIKMLAKDNECMQEAVNSIYMANAEEMVRQKCLAREEAERHERTVQRDMQLLKKEKEQLQGEKEQLQGEKEQLQGEKKQLQKENTILNEEKEKLQNENELLRQQLEALKIK